ncbi:hypothetical protein M1E08_13125 [Erwinia sp. PK3-005]|uniref:Uncharacterized protein n=1 Tax=Mixta hanseatica TaxID=2872648 RepID=A0ABY4RBC7_9GAMM|nr:hypothetical protein [Mixta hanseatica]UQY45648.1 hypothetical protein K6958_08355 [Mixta hanseatica]
MENRDDKLIALIGLLSASLIGVMFLLAMTWLTDIRRPTPAALEVQTCTMPPASSDAQPSDAVSPP